eukprot:scaffold54881_cov30-Attheya_sp.AAC.1
MFPLLYCFKYLTAIILFRTVTETFLIAQGARIDAKAEQVEIPHPFGFKGDIPLLTEVAYDKARAAEQLDPVTDEQEEIYTRVQDAILALVEHEESLTASAFRMEFERTIDWKSKERRLYKYLGWQNAIFLCVNMKRTVMTLFVTFVPAVSMHCVWGGEQEKKYSQNILER